MCRGRAPADPVRPRLRASSVLMGWGMEDSLERADAMRSRGWGAASRRTTYARYRLARGDAAALVGLAVFGAAAVAVAWTATTQYSLYPQLLGAGAVAGLCRVRCMDGAALRVACDR